MCFSSLYIGILAATHSQDLDIALSERFSSLYIGILAATFNKRFHRTFKNLVSVPFTSGSSLQHTNACRWGVQVCVSVPFTSGSSLQLGLSVVLGRMSYVSVPFTSGSSLQPYGVGQVRAAKIGFSSLYIGILAATPSIRPTPPAVVSFQFPLHRDPRCNNLCHIIACHSQEFQFPLHRDPRCN